MQRHQHISGRYHGYYDPDPGPVTGPSGIKSYTIDIHVMQKGRDRLFVGPLVRESHGTTSDEKQLDFELPQNDSPMMYAIVLTTLDHAENPRMARRFVIYDNTSCLAFDKDKHSLRPISANPATDYTWQVSLDPIIIDWQEYFYNEHYKNFNFLLPIREDNKMKGIYEQEDDPIPVSGTPNVHGITTFLYRYDLTSPSRNKSVDFQKVANVLDQNVRLSDLSLSDGDTVDVTVLAIDISNNTIHDSFQLYIDSTPPELTNLGLYKDGDKVFVHDSKSLRTMNFTFEAYDPHSSLHQVRWKLGSHPGEDDIASGALPIVRISDLVSQLALIKLVCFICYLIICLGYSPTEFLQVCDESPLCYCPIIGNCSLLTYAIELNEVIENGNHNREYYFWIEVINKALLRSEEVVKILIDDSPPEVGVVIDGPVGSPDLDYQANNILQWHWRGFIDHESGISKYMFVLGQHCFSREEIMENKTTDERIFHIEETVSEHTSFNVSGPGIYFLSVIAFNNALDPSEAACSSGIIVDRSAPKLKHIHLPAAHTQSSIACSHNNSIWHITPSFTAQPLPYVAECQHHCHKTVDVSIFYQEIHWSNNRTIIFPPEQRSKELCYLLPTYQPEQTIFLATDNLELAWQFEEPESQVNDFFVGLSSNRDNSMIPDIIDYKTTHNKTHFKCSHCGIGEGDR